MTDHHYSYQLVLVMPVYNEEDCIDFVIKSWYEALAEVVLDFKMMIINDGSRDNTKTILEKYCTNPRIEVTSKTNSGHGPTILEGYWKALDLAPWIFQVDSDDEVRPCYFGDLWKQRKEYDALFGIRKNRTQTISHKIVTSLSRLIVYTMFGRGVVDVNVPFRLMQTSLLKEVLRDIPKNAFAPNVLISGGFTKKTSRIYNCPVPWEGRKTGQSSFASWKLVKAAVISFKEAAIYRSAIMKNRT